MTKFSSLGFILGLVFCIGVSNVAFGLNNISSGTPDGSEKWGYVEVRPKAHMFWWLYYTPQRTPDTNWPLILWLQGGPGGSGVGIGNFLEVGPLDDELNPRNTTWLQKAHLLFVDSPVGTGFSYVENDTLIAKSDVEVTADLLSFLKYFYGGNNNTLQNNPLFIVGESYGGKHATMIGLALSKAFAAGDINANLGGVLLGDSWISPVDYVLSWGPLLKAVSRLDNDATEEVNRIALTIQEQVERGDYLNATNTWNFLEGQILAYSNQVNFYNFLHDESYSGIVASAGTESMKSFATNSPQHYAQYLMSRKNKGQIISASSLDLSILMNGPIREKLKIIPSNVTWGELSDDVFNDLMNDFMQSAVDKVDELLSRGEKVTIYNGQVDLICATAGTEAWVQQLKWDGLEGFNSATRRVLYCNESETKGFVKSYKNLQFVWILLAGHMAPADQPCVGLNMLDIVTNSSSSKEKNVIKLSSSLKENAVYGGNNQMLGTPDGSEEWGYVEVRPKAHLFWWLYYSPQRKSDSNWPLLLWLQGGPGASGVGIGNFLEVGPLDDELKPRNTTWLQKAHLLFVDSPVGTGFSYVENDSLLAKSDEEVTADLFSFLKEFYSGNNSLQNNPLYIVGESYGGKHASMIGLALSKAIAAGDIKVNLGGVLLGDSWISPVDYVLSWGPLLKAMSRLDADATEEANRIALKIKQQVEMEEYSNATDTWNDLESQILADSNGVNFYNFLHDDSNSDIVSSATISLKRLSSRTSHHYIQYLISNKGNGQIKPSYAGFFSVMNGPIRKKLKIIPSNVIWDESSGVVFDALTNDFMQSAVDKVDELLSRGENVTIYNGQVDLICATPGTEAWVQQLKWSGLKEFNSTERIALYCNESETKGFVKSFENLKFVWILLAGHMAPVDQPCVGLNMLDLVTNSTI
ncbi:uncharacterized protein LOC131041986 [Cryptomeria japonica]|uniref:uncharacterized protein LOC131041986 n=1 Tax=Cryptomeria japonica TaxID=3369 RepID=UPI0027DA5C63|nr:uncharacterized protein LOC131041986 [Cryptomeria japonica]